MRLIFDDVALADLEDIFHWIAKDNPKAVKAVVERMFASVEHLASFPQMGRRGATRARMNGLCRDCRTSWSMKFTPSAMR